MATLDPSRPLLTVEETAQRLHVSEKTVRRLIGAEVLPALRVSSRLLRVDPDELDSWLYHDAQDPGGVPAPDTPAVRRAAPGAVLPAVEAARPHAGET